jgi:hypothetical protein
VSAPDDRTEAWLAGTSRPPFGHPIPPTVNGKLPPRWEQRQEAEAELERDNGGPE